MKNWNVMTDGTHIVVVANPNVKDFKDSGFVNVCPSFKEFKEANDHVNKLLSSI